MRGFKDIFCDFKTMQKVLKFVKKTRKIFFREPQPKEKINYNAYIIDNMVNLKVIFKEAGKYFNYVFKKDGTETKQEISGGEAFRILSRYYKVPRFEKRYFSASPFMWYNSKYEGQKVKAIGYDMNSAYAFAMLQDMPDTSKKFKSKTVEAGEIGFDLNGNFVKQGEYAFFTFPKMASPFTKFVENWYKKKQNPATKTKAKNVLTFSVGYLQLVNCFLRSAIINYSNKYIANLVDENTIYCNTDSIVSIKARNDLIIGSNVGEFKIEHCGEFAFRGFNYQWYNDVIAYRGIPNKWFGKSFDITKDATPDTSSNLYRLNTFSLKLTKTKLRRIIK